MDLYATVDIGGTTARVATFKTMRRPDIVDFKQFEMSGNYMKDMVQLDHEIRVITGGRPRALGLAIAGLFNHEGTELVSSPNLRDWENQRLQETLEKSLATRVVMANDASAAALGEATYFRHGLPFWYVTWGTGIGVRQVLIDRSLKATIPNSEFGHHVIDMKARSVNLQGNSVKRCACGKAGCWETLSGGVGIRKRYGRPAESLSEREWAVVCQDFALGLRNLVAINPSINQIVIGGGIMVKQRSRLRAIERNLQHDCGGMFRVPRLSVVSTGEQAGVVGGLAVLKRTSR